MLPLPCCTLWGGGWTSTGGRGLWEGREMGFFFSAASAAACTAASKVAPRGASKGRGGINLPRGQYPASGSSAGCPSEFASPQGADGADPHCPAAPAKNVLNFCVSCRGKIVQGDDYPGLPRCFQVWLDGVPDHSRIPLATKPAEHALQQLLDTF